MLYGYLTTPRWYAPRWYLEGIAVYLETWMNGGLGRAIGPYDEMVFRTLVRDSARIFDFVGLESEGTTIDFQVGVNSYLYGTRFISYLGLRYGNDSLIAWFNRTEGSRRYFSAQFRHIYGRSLEDEWSRWIAWERDWQATNLAAIRRHPVTAFRPLTDRALGSVSRAYYDSTSRTIYVGMRYPGQVAHLAAIDVASGRITNLAEILGASGFSVTSLAYDPASRTLFFTTNNADWRNLCALDLATGRSRVLLRNARIGDLAFNPADRSLWAVRHDNGFSTLVRLPAPYHEWNQIQTLPYGRDLFDLDIAPDGSTLIASMSEISGGQKLVRMDIEALLAKQATSPEVLSDFGDWPPSNFVFSPDGKYLFGSSYYSGVSNIYRYDLDRGVMEPLSNTETGYFKPVPLPGDSVVVFRYAARGFIPTMIPNAVPDSVSAIRFLGNEIAATRTDVQSWIPAQDSTLNLDSLTTSARGYRSLAHVALNSAYPVVEGYEDAGGNNAAAIGVRANLSDQIGATALNLTASYAPDERVATDERVHLRADFQSWNWRVTAALNRADFYDLFGPTKVSRRGYSLAVQYKANLFMDDPKSVTSTLRLAGYGHLATLPDYQNVAAPVDRLAAFSADLAFRSFRRSLGAVEDELGTGARAAVYGKYVRGTLFPQLQLEASHGFLLPLNHSSLWLRASAGSALAGDRSNPFARIFFGGFGNNWVDYRDVRQFREVESFPGIGINDVGGASYGKTQVEWVLPPLRFRRVGIPSFYLRWASLSLFTTALVTDVDQRAARRTLASAGAQLDFRLVTLSHLESTLSVGFAVAHEAGAWRRSAGMFSFKIM
jgi:Tol biopolymer transport system component